MMMAMEESSSSNFQDEYQPHHLTNQQAEVLSLLQRLVHLATPAATMDIRNLPEVLAKVPMEGWADDQLR